MIWVLLATLGVPIWLVVGALTGALLSRRRVARRAGVFPAKVRIVEGTEDDMTPDWPRMAVHACWVHDVLLVSKGLALVRTQPLPVASVAGPLGHGDPETIKGLGPQPVLLTVVLDDGSSVELAAPQEHREALVGPFATAGV